MTTHIPHSIDIEQALLGAVLIDNDALTRIEGVVAPDSFYDALHGRLFETMGILAGQGRSVSPHTLAPYFKQDAALAEVGGVKYMARLAAAAVASAQARDYALAVRDLAVRRELIIAGQDLAALAENTPADMPVDKVIGDAEDMLYGLRPAYGGKATAEAEPVHVAAAEAMADLRHILAGGQSNLRKTGLTDLDRLIGGLEPGVVTILAGRPSMGKSSLALQLALREGGVKFGGVSGWTWADERRAVHIASLEMTRKQCARRMLSALTWQRRGDGGHIDRQDGYSGVAYDQIRQGYVREERMPWIEEAEQALASIPIHINDRRGVSVAHIAQQARRTERKAAALDLPLGLVIVDHLGEIKDSGRWGDSKVNAVGETMDDLTTLARDMDVPVLVLAQLNRKVEDRDNKRPQLSDLRDSGEIEQKARCVMFMYRDEYYLQRAEPAHKNSDKWAEWNADLDACKGHVEINVAKLNEGQVGTAKVTGALPYGVFTDMPVVVS